MTPEALRSTLKNWLRSRLRVDNFGLNAPQSILNNKRPPSAGLDLEASDFKITNKDGKGFTAGLTIETILPFQVLFRFGNAYKYSEIPRGKAETILCSLMASLNDAPECVNPDILAINPTGKITIYEETKGDWILEFRLELEIQFQCDFSELSEVDYGVFSP